MTRRVHFAHELNGRSGVRPYLPEVCEDPPRWDEPEWADERDGRIRDLEQQLVDTQRRLAGHLSSPSWNVMARIRWDRDHASPWFGPFRNVTAFREWRQKVKRDWMAVHREPFPYKIDFAYTRSVGEAESWLRGQ